MNPAIRAALAGALAMAVVMGIGRFVYTPILPMMIADGALNVPQAGLVASFNFLGYLVGALATASGVFAPRRRMWFWVGLTASVVTTAAMAIDGGLAWMIVFRFLSGVASAFGMVFITTLVLAKLAEERRAGWIAAHFGGVGIGIAFSAALTSLLALSGHDWQSIWLASGVTGLAALLLVAILLPQTRVEVRSAASPGGGGGGAPWPLIVSYGFFGFGYVITATFINTIARADPALAGVEPVIWLVVGLSGIPSVWLWNIAARSIGVLRAYAIACMVEATAVAISALVSSIPALVVAAAALGGTFIAVTALGLAKARDLAPENPARAIALMTASFGLGQIIGPFAAGWLFAWQGGPQAASLMAALALAVSAALALRLRSHAPHRSADEGAGIDK